MDIRPKPASPGVSVRTTAGGAESTGSIEIELTVGVVAGAEADSAGVGAGVTAGAAPAAVSGDEPTVDGNEPTVDGTTGRGAGSEGAGRAVTSNNAPTPAAATAPIVASATAIHRRPRFGRGSSTRPT